MNHMDDALKDGAHILICTADFGWVEGFWHSEQKNFYKTQRGSASYVSDDEMGDWVSHWRIGTDDDPRLYCGATPIGWLPVPDKNRPEEEI